MRSLRLPLQALLLALLLLVQPVRAEAPAALPPDLLAILWQQTAAEYRAMCLQTFHNATESLRTHVQNGNYRCQDGRRWLETLVRHADGTVTWERRPLALVMDLDETLLDNGGFEAWAVLHKQTFNSKTWGNWMEFQGQTPEAWRALPGGLEMIRQAGQLGISPVFITNRSESGRAGTLAVLRGLGLDAPDLSERLYMQDDANQDRACQDLVQAMGLDPQSPEALRITANASDKEYRRREVQTRFHVVAWFGDNLYDFPVYVHNQTAAGKTTRMARQAEVDTYAGRWGANWFMLPNPMYGSWFYGRAIPKGTELQALDDFGFEAWLKKNPGRR